MIRQSLALCSLLILGACASADVTIQADLYNKETEADRLRKLGQSEQAFIDQSIAIVGVKKIAAACGKNIKQYARDIEDLTVSYQGFATTLAGEGNFNASAAKSVFAGPRNQFDVEVDVAVRSVDVQVETVLQFFSLYLQQQIAPMAPEPGQSESAELVNRAIRYMSEVAKLEVVLEEVVNVFSEGNSPYANSLRGNFNLFATTTSNQIQNLESLSPAQEASADALAQSVTKLSGTLKQLSEECVKISPSLMRNLQREAGKIQSGNLSGIQQAVPALVQRLLTTTRLELGSSAFTSIRSLAINQTRYLSQVDRLQDPADPAWIEVLDPENKLNWTPAFARTTFHAEGNSNVVVVRDRPGHYRVQRGVNNPKALITGQLEINRSLASAATSILGAYTGVNIPVPTTSEKSSDPQGTDSSATPATADTSGATLRTSVAATEEARRIRNSARGAMSAEVQGTIRELNALGANADSAPTTQRDAIYARITPTLKRYGELLKFTGEQKSEEQ